MTRGLFASLLFLLLLSSLQADVQAQSNLKVSFNHEISIHEHGFISITEQVSFINQDSSAVVVEPFEFHYPKSVSRSLAAMSAEPSPGSLRIQEEADFTRIIVAPSGSSSLQPGQSVTYRVTLLFTESIHERSQDEFYFTTSLAPQTNLAIENITTRIILPAKSTIIDAPRGFSLQNGSKQVAQGSSKSDLSAQELGFKVANDSPFAVISFPNAKREISVDALGEIFVKEELEVVNAGNRSVTQIKLNPIGGSITALTILPTSIPPLTIPATIRIENNTLIVNNAYPRLIEKGEKRIISYQYPYPSTLKQVEGSSVRIDPLAASPAEGVVKNYVFRLLHPQSFEATTGEKTLSLQNVGHVGGNAVDISLRPKAVWAAGEVMPLATTVFAVLFVGMYLARDFIGTEASQRLKSAAELRKLLGDKIAENRSMFSDLERLGGEQSSRKALEDIRTRMEESRSKSSRRFPEIGQELAKQGGNVQKAYQVVIEADREYDREARSLLNAYRNYLTSGGRSESLRSAVDETKRRLSKFEERVYEHLDHLTREVS